MRETKRTRWFTAFLHMLLAPFFRWKFGYRYDDFSAVPGPYLLLANHNMNLDPALLGVAAGQDIRFVASEHVLRKGLGSWFLTCCFDPIVHTKGKLGLKSSMDILRSILQRRHRRDPAGDGKACQEHRRPAHHLPL